VSVVRAMGVGVTLGKGTLVVGVKDSVTKESGVEVRVADAEAVKVAVRLGVEVGG
jgi:hypothetical protein